MPILVQLIRPAGHGDSHKLQPRHFGVSPAVMILAGYLEVAGISLVLQLGQQVHAGPVEMKDTAIEESIVGISDDSAEAVLLATSARVSRTVTTPVLASMVARHTFTTPIPAIVRLRYRRVRVAAAAALGRALSGSRTGRHVASFEFDRFFACTSCHVVVGSIIVRNVYFAAVFSTVMWIGLTMALFTLLSSIGRTRHGAALSGSCGLAMRPTMKMISAYVVHMDNIPLSIGLAFPFVSAVTRTFDSCENNVKCASISNQMKARRDSREHPSFE